MSYGCCGGPTASKFKDYYALLGLDADASPESIRLAYRRLARETHPDRATQLGITARADASVRMAEINEARAILGDPAKRRVYDEEYRNFQVGLLIEEPAAVPEVAAEVPTKVPRVRARPAVEVISSVVREFSSQIRKDVLGSRLPFSWKERKFEGFDWALEASSWTAHYCAALRGFTSADPTATLKFTNYANLAISQRYSLIRKNLFLFILLFQRALAPEQVLAQCRLFSGTLGRTLLGRTQTLILLVDVTHGRALPCGPRVRDANLEKLIHRLSVFRR